MQPGSPYPAAYSPHAPQEPAQAGASSSQPSTQLAVRSAKPAASLATAVRLCNLLCQAVAGCMHDLQVLMFPKQASQTADRLLT